MKSMLRYKKVLLFIFSIMLMGEVFSNGRIVNTSMPCKLLEGISSREYSIYLPESYGKNKNKKYPVCYLLHGGNCSCTDFTYEANIALVQAFRNKNIDYQLRVYGGGHDWDYWRPSLVRALKHMSDVFRSINHKK